ncbi:Transcription factor GRAS [Heracleum sosnowskyi]|uniref:Transcription factor GRAS n=1 Tax=Heracleum sosnowskyi TaxID=360622 RepID=A0AAD8GMS0_9APIA|nr:Transcription factor GRAS [Heracleum sosnowskyi]
MLKCEGKESKHSFKSQDWADMNSTYARTLEQCEEATGESDYVKTRNESLPLASIELLKKCGSRMNNSSSKRKNVELNLHVLGNTGNHVLSAEDIMMIAKEKYIQYISHTPDDLSMLFHPLNNRYSGLSCEAAEDVELVVFLLASAETLINRQFHHMKNLLSMCYQLATPDGNPVKRLVFYFAEALIERIHQETGNVLLGEMGNQRRKAMQLQDAMTTLHPAAIACHQQLPISQVIHVTAMQVILENVSTSKRIHLVDIGIKSGLYWVILMQALSVRHECPLELLKITAVISSSRERTEGIGKRLSSFAQSINLPFSFSIVVTSMEDLMEEVFSFETDETVAVYSHLFLSTMLAWPNRLEALMGVMKNIRPRVMVITEIEAHTNSPALMDRLIEALFLYGSLFDCLEACMGCSQFRKTIESVYLWEGIQNLVTSEGEEWIHRHEKIDYWRAFFGRSGLVEMEISASSLSQADFVLKKNPCGKFFTLVMNEKSLVCGWKGAPISSVSAWEFCQD